MTSYPHEPQNTCRWTQSSDSLKTSRVSVSVQEKAKGKANEHQTHSPLQAWENLNIKGMSSLKAQRAKVKRAAHSISAQSSSSWVQGSAVRFKRLQQCGTCEFSNWAKITSRRLDHIKEKLVGVEQKSSSTRTPRKRKEKVQIKVWSKRQELRKQVALFFNAT